MDAIYPSDLQEQIIKLTQATAKHCAGLPDGHARMRSLFYGIKSRLAERTGQPVDDRRGSYDQLYGLGRQLADRINL